MPEMRPTGEGSAFDRDNTQRREYRVPARQTAPAGGSSTGRVVVGALVRGVRAASHFGTDLRRYIKMEMM